MNIEIKTGDMVKIIGKTFTDDGKQEEIFPISSICQVIQIQERDDESYCLVTPFNLIDQVIQPEKIGCSWYPISSLQKGSFRWIPQSFENALINCESDNDEVKLLLASFGCGCGLNVLVNDKNWQVRLAIAKYGRRQDLDNLINDENTWVRREIVKHGIDEYLDVLVHDTEMDVRLEVAYFGRKKDLEILINDEYEYIREVAKLTLADKY